MSDSEKPKPGNKWRALQHGSIGIELVISIALGWLFGSWLDRKFDTQPVLTLVFLGLGIIAGFRALFRLAAKLARQSDDEPPEDER